MSNLNNNELKALKFIRNYLSHYNRPPSVREVMAELDYKSPRSAMLIINNLEKKNLLKKGRNKRIKLAKEDGKNSYNAKTIEIPIVGCAPCGTPFLAEENIEMTVPVSVDMARPPHRYFLLRAIGDSMDQKGIQSGDLVLVRQQATADEGKIVVALIDDEATIKEFHRSNDSIILKPRSSNIQHKSIILKDNFQIQGEVISVIKGY